MAFGADKVAWENTTVPILSREALNLRIGRYRSSLASEFKQTGSSGKKDVIIPISSRRSGSKIPLLFSS
jgi:hypothetical protein